MKSGLKFALVVLMISTGVVNIVFSAAGLAYSYEAHQFEVTPIIIIGLVSAVLFPCIALSFMNEYWHSRYKIQRMADEIDNLRSRLSIEKNIGNALKNSQP